MLANYINFSFTIKLDLYLYFLLLEFQALSYIFVLLLCTVAYSSYTPIRPYSATLIFNFIGGADLACVLDSTAIDGVGLIMVAYIYSIGSAI